jgi:hypothetical protein
MAAGADCGRTLTRPYCHFDTLLVGAELGVLVDKTRETMAAVKNRDQFHGAEASGGTSTINRARCVRRGIDECCGAGRE